MKTTLFAPCLAVLALAVMPVEAEEPKKSLGDRTAETLDKAGEKTKEAGRAIADSSKRAVEAVKDAVTPDADARKVDVKLVDHDIQMPKELSAGKTAFVVKNAGKSKHNFEIEGQGVDRKFFTSLSPDETKTLHVDLKPGTYKVYCPVADHEEREMKLELKVK